MAVSVDTPTFVRPGLGRVRPKPDALDHPLSRHLLLAVDPPRKVLPKVTMPVLDQGQTPRCVGFSGALQRTITEKIAEREPLRFDGDDLYAEAKKIDGYPDEDGTDIRSACKVLRAKGGLVTLSRAKGVRKGDRLTIAAYARLFSLQDIRAAVFAMGSAWVGSDWANSWFDPDPVQYGRATEYVLPKPGKIAGGHAYSIIGYDDDFPVPGRATGAFLIQNNWGEDWARKGRAWLPYEYVDLTTDKWDAWRTFDTIGDR